MYYGKARGFPKGVVGGGRVCARGRLGVFAMGVGAVTYAKILLKMVYPRGLAGECRRRRNVSHGEDCPMGKTAVVCTVVKVGVVSCGRHSLCCD